MLRPVAVQRRAISGRSHWPDSVLVFLFPVPFFSEKIFPHSISQTLTFQIWIAVKQQPLWGSRIKRYLHLNVASADTYGPYPAFPSSKSTKILAGKLSTLKFISNKQTWSCLRHTLHKHLCFKEVTRHLPHKLDAVQKIIYPFVKTATFTITIANSC